MKKPAIPENEERRLEILRSYRILDTEPESEFDELVEVASRIAGTSMSYVSLIDEDRQWFKSKKGFDVQETSRTVSLCGHVVGDDERLVVNDLTGDERFADGPVVQGELGLRFYCGTPLRVDGVVIGTLCVAENTPHKLTDEQLEILETLAKTTMRLIRARRDAMLLSRSEHLARTMGEFILSEHDLPSLLAGIAEIGCERFEAEVGIITRFDNGQARIESVTAPDTLDLDDAKTIALRATQDSEMNVEPRHHDENPESDWGSFVQIPISSENGFSGVMTFLRRDELDAGFSDLDEQELRMLANTLESEVHRILARQARELLLEELQSKLDQIETLHGLIPICSYCKQIRDDEGAWQGIEHYVMERSHARFSHGICPDCYEDEFEPSSASG